MKNALFAGLVFLLALVATGCSKSGQDIAASRTKLFDTAPAEAKAGWATAVAAVATNGYATAVMALSDLRAKGSLNAEQLAAVQAFTDALRKEIGAKAEQGDPAALQGVEALRGAVRR